MQQIPLAERMRPKNLEKFIGQKHLLGKNGFLTKLIQSKSIPSIIFWGPPGVGKTTLAKIIAQSLNRPFYSLSAIQSGVKDLREVLAKAKPMFPPVLFIDEIHRFNKAQQDALLGAVEKGTITLIGATTENPSFEVISALLSRSQVYTLNAHSKEDLLALANQAILEDDFLKKKKIKIKENEALLRFSGGDGRKLLNLLELVVESENKEKVEITNDLVEKYAQQKFANYDKSGEQHYDIISAFIKSIRGSDPNAALYWMARMLVGGEDPKFIARRMLILASEDIGNANPTALVLANNCFQAINVIGMPEARIILSQTVIYLASSPKSNASYKAISNAMKLAQETSELPVPLHLRNAPTKLMKELNYGKNYDYSHQNPNNFAVQEYLPKGIQNQKIFEPQNNPRENEIRNRLQNWWKEKYNY